MSGFNDPEKKRKQLRTLILGLKSMIKVLKGMLNEFFPFYSSIKNSKINLTVNNTAHLCPCKSFFKRPLVLQKYLKLTFINYRKGIFNENDLKNIKII